MRSAAGLARSQFQETAARALFAGLAAHSVLPLERPVSAAIGLVLGLLGHAVGWPFPRGGAQRLADALAGTFRALGGEIVTGWEVTSLRELPPSRVVLLDVTPRQLLAIAGVELSSRQKRPYQKYRYGPGVFKIDWALSEPIPWRAAACKQAAVVHLGGALAEIALSEQQVWRDMPPQRPFVLLAQPTLFDDTRAPQGRHVAWAYCHVPHGALIDMTERIENQIERFAPGFRDIILARHTMNPMQMHAYNPNYIGGDINGGVQDIWQLFTRPTLRLSPYKTPAPGVYLCSSSTPPGGGVHGMCGYHAAQAALADLA